MDAKNAVADREIFDAWTLARLEKCIDDPDQLARVVERQYPRTIAQAVDELRWRGFDASEALAERFAERVGVEIFGGALAWYKSDVDHLAEFCESSNRLTVGTRHRIMRNITWEQDHADAGDMARRSREQYAKVSEIGNIPPVEEAPTNA